MSDIREVLEALCTVEGVTGAFLIDEQGKMMESFSREKVDSDYIADLAHRCFNTGGEIADSLGGHVLKQTYIEFSDSNLTLDLLSNGAIMALLASSGANLGRIRLEIRKTKKKVEKQLA